MVRKCLPFNSANGLGAPVHRRDVGPALYLTLAAAAVALASLTHGVSCHELRSASAEAGPRGWQAAAAAAAEPIPRRVPSPYTQPYTAGPAAAAPPLGLEEARLRERKGSLAVIVPHDGGTGSWGEAGEPQDGELSAATSEALARVISGTTRDDLRRGVSNHGASSPATWLPLLLLAAAVAFAAGFAAGCRQGAAAGAAHLEAAAAAAAAVDKSASQQPEENMAGGGLVSEQRPGSPGPVGSAIALKRQDCGGATTSALSWTGPSPQEVAHPPSSGQQVEGSEHGTVAGDGGGLPPADGVSQAQLHPISGLIFLKSTPSLSTSAATSAPASALASALESGSTSGFEPLSGAGISDKAPGNGFAQEQEASSGGHQGSIPQAQDNPLVGACASPTHKQQNSQPPLLPTPARERETIVLDHPTAWGGCLPAPPTASASASASASVESGLTALPAPEWCASSGLPPAAHAEGEMGTTGAAPEGPAWDEATALVAALAQRLRVDLNALSASDKIQLISVVMAAWQTCQQRSHHHDTARLGADANELRREHTAVVHGGLQSKEARHSAAAAAASAAALQAGAVDCLLAGLALMVATCLYSGMRYGYLGQRIAACPPFHSGGGGGWGLLSPLQALRPLQAVACWAFTTGDVMLGVAMVLGLAFGALRTSALSGVQATPLLRLLLGLGLLAGGLGYVAIGKMGGDAGIWLAHWEAWVGVQSLVIWYPGGAQWLRRRPEGCGWPRWAAASLVAPAWLLLVAVVAPLSAGLHPFRRTVLQEFSWLGRWAQGALFLVT